MVVRNACMLGGPPWGLRFAPTNDGQIRITQVLPNGRADREGIRIGDIVESVNGQQCTTYKMFHSKVRAARGVLRLRLIRGSTPINGKQLPPAPTKSATVRDFAVKSANFDGSKLLHDAKLATELASVAERAETAMPVDRPLSISIYNSDTPHVSSKPYRIHAPPEIFPPHASNFVNVIGHDGGMRGSAHDKRRFFEILANKKMFRVPTHMDQLLHQKIEFGSPSLQSSDQGTVVSGYDSVGGDFAGFTQSVTGTDTGRQSSSSSDFAEENSKLEKQTVAAPSPPVLATAAAAAVVVPALSAPAYPSSSSVHSPFTRPESRRNSEFSLSSRPEHLDNNQLSPVSSYNPSAPQSAFDEQSKKPQTAEPNEQEPVQLLGGHEIESLVNQIRNVKQEIAILKLTLDGDKLTLQLNFTEPSEKAYATSAEMMGTAPLPPPPPPPPSTGVVPTTALKNGSSSGEIKWKMRTEIRNCAPAGDPVRLKAEGLIEVPERQTVASLRQQIASKLGVKMPTSSTSVVTATTATDNNAPVTQLPSNGSSFLDKQQYSYAPHYDSTYQNLTPSKSTPVINADQQPYQRALSEQRSVVHEPVERHLSCITPVPFSHTAILTSWTTFPPNFSSINSNNVSLPPTAFYRSTTFSPAATDENSGYSGSTSIHITRSAQLNDYPEMEPVNRYTVDDHTRNDQQHEQLLPFSPAVTIPATVTDSDYNCEQTTVMPSAPCRLAEMINGHSESGNERRRSSRNLEKLASVDKNNLLVNGGTDAAYGDSDDADGRLAAASSSVVVTQAPATAVPPLSKPVEPKIGAVPSVPGSFYQSLLLQQRSVNNRNVFSVPEWEPRNDTSVAVASRYEALTENSKWYRNMFKKMHIIDQPGKLSLLQNFLSSGQR